MCSDRTANEPNRITTHSVVFFRNGSIIVIFVLYFEEEIVAETMNRDQITHVLGLEIESNATYTVLGVLHIGVATVEIIDQERIPDAENLPDSMVIWALFKLYMFFPSSGTKILFKYYSMS